jgi:hypothetical protein
MAAMSEKFAAAALRPTSVALDQSRRKCRFSISKSVVATTRPSVARITAASSPGPISVVSAAVSPAVTRAMRPNSPTSETVISRPHSWRISCAEVCTTGCATFYPVTP